MAPTTEKAAITIKDLAATLDTDARSLRAFLRDHDLGCGRGTRYAWPSMADAKVKRIVREWRDAQKSDAPEEKSP